MAKLTEGTPVTALVTPGMDDQNPWATGDARWMRGGLHFAMDIKARDKIPLERRYGSVVLVWSNADGDKQAFKWTGAKEDGTDGAWQEDELGTQDIPAAGISFVNPDGSTTTGIELLALKGLVLSGNEKDGFTLGVSKGSSGASFDVTSSAGAQYAVIGADGIKLGPYLECYPDPNSDKAVIMIKPAQFEPMGAPGYLAYNNYPIEIVGKSNMSNKYHRGTIWYGMPVCASGAYIPIDEVQKTFGLQEIDNLDPNVTGGQKVIVACVNTLRGTAPDDGYVEIVMYEKKTGEIAVDVDGNLMGVKRNYKAGQPLAPNHDPLLLAGIMNAKGLTNYSIAIIDSFESDSILIEDYSNGPSGLLIQYITKDSSTSDAIQQFEADIGFSIRPETRYFGPSLADMAFSLSRPIAPTVVKAGLGMLANDGIDFHNITDVKASVSNGQLMVEESGGFSDFYVGERLSRGDTIAMQGKQIEVDVSLIDKDSGWNVGFFSFKGDGNPPAVYDSRNNGSLNINKGWTQFDTGFISEDVVSGLHATTFTATVPADADIVAAFLYPVSSSVPKLLTLKALRINAKNPFIGGELARFVAVGLKHLHHKLNTNTLIQGPQGYGSLRYTINKVAQGAPMPWGIAEESLVGMHLDKSKNVIVGSAAKGGEGALVADNELSVTVRVKLLISNEQASLDESDWWIVKGDVDGVETVVPGSKTNFEIDGKKMYEEFYMNKVKIHLFPGEYIMLRSSSNVSDGSFIQTINKARPMVDTTLEIDQVL